MKIKIQIKSVSGKVLFELEKENNTIKETLEQAVKANANLGNANLGNANLGNANLGNANLINANLEYANLRYANLEYANLRNANLRNANLGYANLEYANLTSASLNNANLTSANLYNANLEYASLNNANLTSASLNNANLNFANNKETAILPIFCKWSYGIKGDLIKIGCVEKTIEQWDLWFDSEKVYSTSRNTKDFKQIEAIYNALKYYYLTLNK